jgi:hypothetical protein
MTDDNQVSILICKDAGAASRTLLARADLRIRWALTEAEALAVVRLTRCSVVITRAVMAKRVLAECAKAERAIASIVLLEASQWADWREYFDAGATAVLRAGVAEELLDAMTDATGTPFRAAPRVPFKTSVRFVDGGGEWTSLNLSTTGIGLVDFPPYALGSEVDLVLAFEGKEFEFNAIVSQIFRIGSQRAVGLAFGETTPEFRAYVSEYTNKVQYHDRPVSEPADVFDPLDENTVMQLRLSTVQGDSLALIRELTSVGTVREQERASPWLVAACESLTAVEVASIQSPKSAPDWAHDALLARLRAYQARERAATGPPGESDVREVMGLCQRLAETAANADEAGLVTVANIRGDVLRALYDPAVLDAVPR